MVSSAPDSSRPLSAQHANGVAVGVTVVVGVMLGVREGERVTEFGVTVADISNAGNAASGVDITDAGVHEVNSKEISIIDKKRFKGVNQV